MGVVTAGREVDAVTPTTFSVANPKKAPKVTTAAAAICRFKRATNVRGSTGARSIGAGRRTTVGRGRGFELVRRAPVR
jgi:hypothetical protein